MVDKKLTFRLAELGKIGFTDGELEKMAADMKNIIALMDKVRDFDDDVMPYTQDAVGYSNLRRDEYTGSYNSGEITANAKDTKNNCFTVPKVV